MEFNFIKIEKSFNKKETSLEKTEEFFNYSTKGQEHQAPITINSQTVVSSTVGQIQNSLIKNTQNKTSIMRDIFVGAIGALTATIISYFIFGIK